MTLFLLIIIVAIVAVCIGVLVHSFNTKKLLDDTVMKTTQRIKLEASIANANGMTAIIVLLCTVAIIVVLTE